MKYRLHIVSNFASNFYIDIKIKHILHLIKLRAIYKYLNVQIVIIESIFMLNMINI